MIRGVTIPGRTAGTVGEPQMDCQHKESTMNATIQSSRTTARRDAGPGVPAAGSPVIPRTRLLGAALIVAPLLLLASSLASAAGSEATRGVLGFYAFATFALVVVTLTQSFAATLPRAAAALTVVGVLGAAAGVGFSIDAIHSTLPGSVELIDDGGTAGVLVANVPGLMGPLAWIGIGIALLRSGVQPRWCGAALVVAGLLFPVSRIGDIAALAIVDDLIFLLALAPLGWAIVQGRETFGRKVDG